MAKSFGDTGIILMIFVGVIIAVVFSMQIATDTNRQTNLITKTNESIDMSTARNNTGFGVTGYTTVVLTVGQNQNVTGNTPISGFAMINSVNGSTIPSTLYTLDSTFGNFTLVANDYWNSSQMHSNVTNTTLVTYNYKHPDYVDENSSRNVIPLILIFAVLAIVIFILVVLWMPGSSFSQLVRGTLVNKK